MRGRETASGRIEKLAVGAPVPKQKVSIVERKGPGWTGWLDSQGDANCPICGTRSSSRHGSYVRSLLDLPAQGTSLLIQTTWRVAGPPRAPCFTCHKMVVWPIGMPRRASARVPHRVKQIRVCGNTTEVNEGPGGTVRILNQSTPPPFRESVNMATQNLYARSRELVGDRNPREHEFTVQLRSFDAAKFGAQSGVPVLLSLASALLGTALKGGGWLLWERSISAAPSSRFTIRSMSLNMRYPKARRRFSCRCLVAGVCLISRTTWQPRCKFCFMRTPQMR
jgi:hypothetical protein